VNKMSINPIIQSETPSIVTPRRNSMMNGVDWIHLAQEINREVSCDFESDKILGIL
jgi:hypothetical protein